MSRFFSIAAACALSLILLAIAAYLLSAFALPAAMVLLDAGSAHPRLLGGAVLLAIGVVLLAAFGALRTRAKPDDGAIR
jgi:hypothetical protein